MTNYFIRFNQDDWVEASYVQYCHWRDWSENNPHVDIAFKEVVK